MSLNAESRIFRARAREPTSVEAQEGPWNFPAIRMHVRFYERGDPRETTQHQEDHPMSAERYAGSEGLERLRKDEARNTGAARGELLEERRDLQMRCPYGRALDVEDVESMCDEGNQTNRAIVLRRLLLAELRKNLPAAVLITRDEREQLVADSIEHPTRPGPCPKIPEWPAAR